MASRSRPALLASRGTSMGIITDKVQCCRRQTGPRIQVEGQYCFTLSTAQREAIPNPAHPPTSEAARCYRRTSDRDGMHSVFSYLDAEGVQPSPSACSRPAQASAAPWRERRSANLAALPYSTQHAVIPPPMTPTSNSVLPIGVIRYQRTVIHPHRSVDFPWCR